MISGFIAAFGNYIRRSGPAAAAGLNKTRLLHYKINVLKQILIFSVLYAFMKMFIAFCRRYSLMPDPIPFNAAAIRSETGGCGFAENRLEVF